MPPRSPHLEGGLRVCGAEGVPDEPPPPPRVVLPHVQLPKLLRRGRCFTRRVLRTIFVGAPLSDHVAGGAGHHVDDLVHQLLGQDSVPPPERTI